MKNRQIILFFAILLALLSSCVIREPESKSVLTNGGMKMFRLAEDDIMQQVRIFDIMLFLDKYMHKPESQKALFLKDSSEYNLRIFDNKCLFRANYDTLYVKLDSQQSIYTPGVELYVVSKDNYNDTIRVKCVQKNKWQIAMERTGFMNWGVKQLETTLTCLESSSPTKYKNSDFEITGSANLESLFYGYDTFMDYTITEPLKHIKGSTVFNTGAINVSAVDSVSLEQQTVVGTYINTTKPSVEISIRGISYVYENWAYYYY